MKRVVAIALLVAASACKPAETPKAEVAKTPTPADASTHEAEIMKWRESRLTRLKAEDGWLSLVGLHWMREGENTPIEGVHLTMKDGKVTLAAPAGATIEGKRVTDPTVLNDDTAENGPTFVQMGTKRFNVIKRGPKFALRVKDSQAETRTKFAGLEYYPIDPKWRVEARLEPYNPVKKIPITDITGLTTDNDSPGALVFTVDGKEYRLDPILEEAGGDYFIIFKDETSKNETYPAGRYLYAKPADASGKVIVDFNKAYNPPCAFTPYATCPLPPQQNRLAVRVDAGEKNYALSH